MARGLRILSLHAMTTTLSTKQVARLMSHQEDLTTQVLHDYYDRGLNLERYVIYMLIPNPRCIDILTRTKVDFPTSLMLS